MIFKKRMSLWMSLWAGALLICSLGVNAAPLATKKKKKNTQYINGDVTSKSSNSGADSTEGWIIKRTKDGKIIKIPKKQTFKFGGSDVSGEANRPAETLLGSRLTPKAATLIPERRSYRKEILGTVGYQERTSK